MRIHRVERLPIKEWIAFDASMPAPCFTARPAWALAWSEAVAGYEPMPLRCILEDGDWVVVPLLHEKARLGWRIATGMPWNEPIVIMHSQGDLATPQQCEAALEAVARNAARDCVSVTLWPLCEQRRARMPWARWTDEMSVIDLQDGAEAAIARMDGRSRRMAGQAARRGIQCARARGTDALKQYFALLEESARRWGRDRPSVTRQMLESITRFGSGDVEVWFAYHEDVPVAGGVVLYGSLEMYFWSAAMLSEYAHLRPSNALNVALIRAAADRGMRWYNMGSSFGLKGVREFKDRLGAVPIPYETLHREGLFYRAYGAAKAHGARYLRRAP